MDSHLTPLNVVEALIAPRHALGEVLGLGQKAAYAWVDASKWRDAGDLPPRVNRALLAHAAARGIPLTAEHLIWGASRAEIDALRPPVQEAAE